MNNNNLIVQNKTHMTQAVEQNLDIIQSMPMEMQEEFKANVLELATNDYLLSAVHPREIIEFAKNITLTGLNVNPVYKEVYIVPFNTKVRGSKIMIPQAIIPLNGMQEMAYKNGLFLRVYSVFKIGNETVSTKEMKRHHQAQLQTSSPSWVDANFVGFDVVLIDLRHEMPEQIEFVEVSYLREVTKTIKDERFKTQTWRHKAVRKAFDNFLVPRNRQIDVFAKVDHINNAMLEKSEDIKVSLHSLKQLGLDVVQDNAFLVIKGNTFGKTEHLKQLGFRYQSGKWLKEQEEFVEEATVIDTEPKQQPANNTSPARQMFGYLVKKGLDKEQVSTFVRDVLGLSKDQDKELIEVLSDEGLLSKMVDTFLAEPTLETA